MSAHEKQVVKYTSVQFTKEDVIGGIAIVVPVDHPSYRVVNGQEAFTTNIVAYDETTGIFETLNTVYTPE